MSKLHFISTTNNVSFLAIFFNQLRYGLTYGFLAQCLVSLYLRIDIFHESSILNPVDTSDLLLATKFRFSCGKICAVGIVPHTYPKYMQKCAQCGKKCFHSDSSMMTGGHTSNKSHNIGALSGLLWFHALILMVYSTAECILHMISEYFKIIERV